MSAVRARSDNVTTLVQRTSTTRHPPPRKIRWSRATWLIFACCAGAVIALVWLGWQVLGINSTTEQRTAQVGALAADVTTLRAQITEGGQVPQAPPAATTLRALPGPTGASGAAGLDAYQVAVSLGFDGSRAAWLAQLAGATGRPGSAGGPGAPGTNGKDGANGSNGADGKAGEAVQGQRGADGNSITGAPGRDGGNGADGGDGPPGPAGSNGVDGAPGLNGPAGIPGRGIASTQCQGEGAESTWVITYDDGSATTSPGPCRVG